MSLLLPDSGLLFWMFLSFGIVFVILAKYGFPVIIKMVEGRKTYIDQSLEVAREANAQLSKLKQEGDALVAAANKELEEYKGMDIEGLRKSAADWQAKAEQAEKDADARVAAFQFDAKLDHAITAARGRNGKAIRALLDLDALRTSKDPDKDIAAALTAVQKDNGYMFDTAPTPPPLAAGTGSTTMIGGKDADTAMRKAMGLPTK